MFGSRPKLPIDATFERGSGCKTSTKDTKEYLDALKQRIRATHEIAMKHTEKAQMKQKGHFDRKAKSSKITAGDRVLI